MYKIVKRILDLVLAILLLVIFLIPLIIISIIIKIDSKGPIIFKQKRTGKDGKIFILYKFRSMEYCNDFHNFKEENKLTKVGKFLRDKSLDELPQLINIIKNDMSFIGPRPWVLEYYEFFTEKQKKRLSVKPGITGLAQVNGRNNLNIYEKIKLDIDYVDNLSFKTDLKICLLTIKTLFIKEGSTISKLEIKNEIDELKANYLKESKKLNQTG